MNIELNNLDIRLDNLKNIKISGYNFNNCTVNINNTKNLIFKNISNIYNSNITIKNSNVIFNNYQSESKEQEHFIFQSIDNASLIFKSKISGFFTVQKNDGGSYSIISNHNINNNNIMIEMKQTDLPADKFKALCDLTDGSLINHHHLNLIYNKDIDILGPGSTPGVEDPTQIEQTFYDTINKDTYLPILLCLPIGAIHGWVQTKSKTETEWLPKIPIGFYELTDKKQTINISIGDINNVAYNYWLAVIILNTNELHTAQTFDLPAYPPISIPTSPDSNIEQRIVYIMKYNFAIALNK